MEKSLLSILGNTPVFYLKIAILVDYKTAILSKWVHGGKFYTILSIIFRPCANPRNILQKNVKIYHRIWKCKKILSQISFVTIMCCSDESVEFDDELSWLFTKRFRAFYLICRNSQILLKISIISILLTFMYLVELNLIVNSPTQLIVELNSSLRHITSYSR